MRVSHPREETVRERQRQLSAIREFEKKNGVRRVASPWELSPDESAKIWRRAQNQGFRGNWSVVGRLH